MDATIEFSVNFWTLGFLALNFLMVLLTFLANRQKAARDDVVAIKSVLDADINKLKSSTEELKSRVARIESDIEHLPDHEHIGELHEKINNVATLTASNNTLLGALEKQLSEINKYLRENK